MDCTNFSAKEYPTIFSGMRVKLFNGTEGEISNIELGTYFFFYNDYARYHIMDIKFIFNP
jgi:hypothetical protein